MRKPSKSFSRVRFYLVILMVLMFCSCARVQRYQMQVSAYCACSKCCSWERGRWLYLKLNVWNRYVSKGPSKGRPYKGLTASGEKPREPNPGLFSVDTICHPLRLPGRLLPWEILPHEGTISADTHYFPFGTKMYVPGYGWALVEDRGGAIKGANRIDVYISPHSTARKWGQKQLLVKVLEY